MKTYAEVSDFIKTHTYDLAETSIIALSVVIISTDMGHLKYTGPNNLYTVEIDWKTTDEDVDVEIKLSPYGVKIGSR